MTNFSLPSGAQPIENPKAFNHQGLQASGASIPFVPNWTNNTQAAPVAAAPQAPVITPAAAPAPKASGYNILDLPKSYDEVWELATRLSKSSICPVAARNPADVFVMLAKAEALGMSWPDAFTNFYVMPNAKTGEIKICMYVKTKEGVCRKYGSWHSEVDLINGSARAWGTRYSDGHKEERTFNGFDASLRGLLKKENGQVVGVGKWADKWPDMLRTRAVGRLLDALFPDVIGGFTSYEEMSDLLLEAELKREATVSAEATDKTDAILNKTRRTKKAVKPEDTEASTVAAPAPVEAAAPTSLETLIEASDELTVNPLA